MDQRQKINKTSINGLTRDESSLQMRSPSLLNTLSEYFCMYMNTLSMSEDVLLYMIPTIPVYETLLPSRNPNGPFFDTLDETQNRTKYPKHGTRFPSNEDLLLTEFLGSWGSLSLRRCKYFRSYHRDKLRIHHFLEQNENKLSIYLTIKSRLLRIISI